MRKFYNAKHENDHFYANCSNAKQRKGFKTFNHWNRYNNIFYSNNKMCKELFLTRCDPYNLSNEKNIYVLAKYLHFYLSFLLTIFCLKLNVNWYFDFSTWCKQEYQIIHKTSSITSQKHVIYFTSQIFKSSSPKSEIGTKLKCDI